MAPKQPVAGPSRPRQSVNNPTSSHPPPAAVSAFSPSGSSFALAHPALGSADKVTIWNIQDDRVLAEWEVENASKVCALCWANQASAGAHGKKRRKKDANGVETEDVVVVATTKGPLLIYSPSQGLQRKLDLPSPATAIATSGSSVLVTTSSSLRLLSPDLTQFQFSAPLPPNTPPPTAIAALSSSTSDSLHVAIASSSVTILHIDLATSKVTDTSSPIPVSTTSVTSIVPLPSSSSGTSFLVISDDDRTVSQYTIQTGTKARLSYRYASPTLSPVHSASFSTTLLSLLHKSGEISLFPLPTLLDFARIKSDSKPSTIKLVEGKNEKQARICRAVISTAEEGQSLLCGRMVGGGRVRWVKADYLAEDGSIRPETKVRCDAQDLVATGDKAAGSVQRFSANSNPTEAPVETGDDQSSALPADVDMADQSLGERLLALPSTSNLPNGDTDDSAPAASKRDLPIFDEPVNAQSLTRLLTQALHTSDPALLSLCLTHRDPVLIRNTIRKMPAQLALPLLKACVERLGQGKGASRKGGGRGMGQNEQQGRGTVEWVKGVLVERGAVLMTMPSLPAHLGALSRLLDTRLQLYQPLLSLSGRLDLALAQIAMRRIALEQTAAAKQGKEAGTHYIEGESDDEVEVEVGDGEGEVEDVDMRVNGYSDSDEDEGSDDESGDEEDEDDEDEEAEDEDEDEDPLESDDEDGLLDLEAEESDDESEEGSEDE